MNASGRRACRSDDVDLPSQTTDRLPPLGRSSLPFRRDRGPESGWNQHETEQFVNLGFTCFKMGERILRVEIAATYLLGQIEMLRRFSGAV